MYMAMSHFLQPENQAIKREKESGENLRSSSEKRGKM